MTRSDFVRSLLEFGQTLIRHLTIVRSDRKTLPFQKRAGDVGESFVEFLFCGLEDSEKLHGHLFPQPVPARNIKSVTAKVNNSFNIHAPTHILQVATSDDCYRDATRQRPQELP